jgi:hypothetical protein
MNRCMIGDRIGWYCRLMELFERAASRQAVHELLDELLAAAGDGLGAPPVRIEGGAMLVPAELYDLLIKLIDEHGLAGRVGAAVDADYKRQQDELRSAAAELGLDPGQVAPQRKHAALPAAG